MTVRLILGNGIGEVNRSLLRGVSEMQKSFPPADVAEYLARAANSSPARKTWCGFCHHLPWLWRGIERREARHMTGWECGRFEPGMLRCAAASFSFFHRKWSRTMSPKNPSSFHRPQDKQKSQKLRRPFFRTNCNNFMVLLSLAIWHHFDQGEERSHWMPIGCWNELNVRVVGSDYQHLGVDEWKIICLALTNEARSCETVRSPTVSQFSCVWFCDNCKTP